MDKDVICDYGNLYKAYKKAKSGKKYNSSTAKFEAMSLEGLHMLKEQLENQTYRMNPYNEFKVYEPKERVIKSCSFKDKVVQHCLCDNILLPRLKYEFIKTNYAGQLGKGHEVLKDIVDYYFDDEYTKWLNHLYIDSTAGLGLPLGNQVAQVYALLMLNGLDHFITGELGVELYGRYMDDFYLIAPSKEYLKHCLDCINQFVASLGLSLNGKTQIVPFKNGILFTGFHHYVTKDGKYIRKLNSTSKRKVYKKIKTWAELVNNGKMTEKKFYEKYGALKNHMLHGNCVKLCHSMDVYVNELLER